MGSPDVTRGQRKAVQTAAVWCQVLSTAVGCQRCVTLCFKQDEEANNSGVFLLTVITSKCLKTKKQMKKQTNKQLGYEETRTPATNNSETSRR